MTLQPTLDLILCHTTADFDALGAAVGLSLLKPGAKIVLPGGAHPTVSEFLALHRDELALIERRSVTPEHLRSIVVVDATRRDRVGRGAEWLDLPQVKVELYDHHPESETDIPVTHKVTDAVGATTTLIVEKLQAAGIQPNPLQATVMALGIHVDTGSLRFEQTTPRDAQALAWLLSQGVSQRIITEYVEPSLSPQLLDLLAQALDTKQSVEVHGQILSWVLLETEDYVAGLSAVAEELADITESDAVLFAVGYFRKEDQQRLTIIARSRVPTLNLNQILSPLGGGGHPQAASVTMRDVDPQQILADLVEQVKSQIPPPPTARDIMSSPVRTIRPDTTIAEAQRILLRYGHSGLSVVNEEDQLVGVISRRDLDLALHHGFSHAPVKGYMSRNVRTISPETSLAEIESIMVTYDVGRLPVLNEDDLVGIVTRTDVLRQRHRGWDLGNSKSQNGQGKIPQCLLADPQTLIPASTWQLLTHIAEAAEARGWHLYLVGGAVRDLLLAEEGETVELQDIDLVVDGFYNAADASAGVELAETLQEQYPQARLEVHGAFQTAALLWHNDPELGSLWVDIATARTEFYPYPAANPEVEASSIRQDLYRRDFTINALALRLSAPRAGELLDFFGGLLDLQARLVRVLHANSFIEDPTRIYRAVRFAVRLGFTLESQTEAYIRYAIESGVYDRFWQDDNHRAPALQTRLKAELKYILQAPYWKPALSLLADLTALRCLHPHLSLDAQLWWQVRLVSRCLRRFDPDHQISHWQMRLEVLISQLDAAECAKVARNLQLPADSIERVQTWEAAKQRVRTELTLDQGISPSQVVQQLRRYKLPMLVLLATKTSRPIRHYIWRYLNDWSQVKPPLNGNDLKALGYKPGPQYKAILDLLLAAKLDGRIGDDAEEAVNFLKQYYHS